MTDSERITIANLARLQAMQAVLAGIETARLEDDGVQKDIGIPLRKWVERLEERLRKGPDR